jgi:hypothetical protein
LQLARGGRRILAGMRLPFLMVFTLALPVQAQVNPSIDMPG